jgi:porphyrinogen peroxidase
VAFPQIGVFALGNLAQTYLELGLRDPARAADLVAAVADLSEPRTTMGGVNLVAGFRPELWREVAPDRSPGALHGFDEAVIGPDGFTMPATQQDVVLWIGGGSFDAVFDAALEAVAAISELAELMTDTVSWSYHRDLDLTGFIDGTENPTLLEAGAQALVPEGSPGAGGSVLLLQKWRHAAAAWSELSQGQQEQVMGRTKPDSIELDDKAESSHVARTDQDEFGHIFRRNTPYGWVSDHGTMFVGFSAEQAPLARMLDSMAGRDGVRDDLTRFATPLTGAYYFVPSADDLLSLGTPGD